MKKRAKNNIFKKHPSVAPRPRATAAMSHKVGDPNSGLTVNRSKPSGGAGCGGPTTSVK